MAQAKQKVLIELKQDETGYPPFPVESLWVLPTEQKDTFIIDNIPFYAYEISLGDIVLAKEKEGEFYFQEIIRKSGNSTLRIYSPDLDCGKSIQKDLIAIGCRSEKSNLDSLYSVNVPEHVLLDSVIELIQRCAAKCKDLEYEDACIRHNYSNTK